MLHGNKNFHPVIQVARHQISAPDQQLVLSTMTKIVDPHVFKKTPDHRGDSDGFADPGKARSQTTDTPHLKINPDSGLRCVVERLDTLRIDQRVHLESDISITMLAVAARLALDPIEQLLSEHRRCDEQF
jgi:hypothetical protein